jgi:6-pyruvoyltetrahydropterin/6-carboxytetrahydropterin synthase
MPRVRLTRRYRFSSAHRLHSPALSDEANRTIYGKCNNPFGHGHNYVLDVTISGELDENTGRLMPIHRLDDFVHRAIVNPMHLANLNTQIEEFARLVPTTENLASVVLDRLAAAWTLAFPGERATLEKVRIWETRNNIFQLAVPAAPDRQPQEQTGVAAART